MPKNKMTTKASSIPVCRNNICYHIKGFSGLISLVTISVYTDTINYPLLLQYLPWQHTVHLHTGLPVRPAILSRTTRDPCVNSRISFTNFLVRPISTDISNGTFHEHFLVGAFFIHFHFLRRFKTRRIWPAGSGQVPWIPFSLPVPVFSISLHQLHHLSTCDCCI